MLKDLINAACVVVILILLSGGGGTPLVVDKPDTVAVIYESSDDIPKPYVTGALGQLQADGFQTRIFDKDVVTGTGQIPNNMKEAIEEAIKNGLPAIVVLSKGKVIKAQDLPQNESEIIEVVK